MQETYPQTFAVFYSLNTSYVTQCANFAIIV